LRSLSLGSACAERKGLGRAITTYATIAVAVALLLGSGPAPAGARSGGAAPAKPPAGSPQPAAPQAGPAQIADVRCVGNPTGACIDPHRVDRGGTVTLSGRSLAGSAQVIFYGRKGSADDVLAPAQSASRGKVLAGVPSQAQIGPLAAIDAAGRRSARWDGLVVESPEEGLGALRPVGALAPVQIAVSEPHRIFFGGMQRALFNFRVTGGRPLDVQVNLLRLPDGALVRTWQRKAVAPNAIQRIAWNGGAGGHAQPQGTYAFRVATPGAVGSSAQGPPAAEEPVTLLDHMFPIQGAHQYAMGAGRFGAARRGHTHQGQDVPAACGTPLVAARGGKVLYSGYHSLAGYYVVIDGQGTGIDSAYMHLREPALVATGARVSTGQPLGQVGDTGDAQGCHLHFEEWSAPGWYRGGRPFDPLPDLKRWDATS
jgi:murein DD-endopeptidase MepM/ murein hydrolase activator NlpD